MNIKRYYFAIATLIFCSIHAKAAFIIHKANTESACHLQILKKATLLDLNTSTLLNVKNEEGFNHARQRNIYEQKAVLCAIFGIILLPMGFFAIYYGIKSLQYRNTTKKLASIGIVIGVIEVISLLFLFKILFHF